MITHVLLYSTVLILFPGSFPPYPPPPSSLSAFYFSSPMAGWAEQAVVVEYVFLPRDPFGRRGKEGIQRGERNPLLFDSIFKSNKRKSYDNEIKDVTPIYFFQHVLFSLYLATFMTHIHHPSPNLLHFGI